MEGVTLNIFLGVEPCFEDLLIDLSLKLRKAYNLKYYVDGKKFYPHLSLLGMFIPEYNLEKIIAKAAEFFLDARSIEIRTQDIFCSTSGIVMLRVQKNQRLMTLHSDTLNTFNPFRENLITAKYEDEKYLQALPEKDRSLILKYGNKWVLDNYDPHITFARLENIGDFAEIKDMYESTISNKDIVCNAIKITREYFGDDNRSEIIFEHHKDSAY